VYNLDKLLSLKTVQRGTDDSLTGFIIGGLLESCVAMVTASLSLPWRTNRLGRTLEGKGEKGIFLRPPWVAELKGQQIWQQNEYFN